MLDEFIARTEEALSARNAGKQLAKKDIKVLEAKRAKLVDMHLEEIIDKETYEVKEQIELLKSTCRDLQDASETESTMKRRISEFRKTLEQNEVIDTFDRYVFEIIVEKVIVGGYDEDGNKDPSMLTFIYKTGFKNSVDSSREKTAEQQNKTPVCVPIQPTRQSQHLPIIVTTQRKRANTK